MVCTDGNKVRVHPRNQQNQFVRINGWTRPIHYLQVIAWVVLFLFSLVYFGVVAIAVVTPWKPAAYVCVGILLLLHVAAHLAATTKNPGDENARAQIKQNHQMPDFDRSKHEHVIENEYCNLCETYVNKESKHCRACNKCVKHFDHHCLWLNNCVGQRNYRYFFTTISTAFLGSLVIVIVSLFVFINSLMEFQYLDPNVWWKSVSPPLFQAFIGVLIVLCIICCALLGQLFFFHLLLIRRGITTYDYIQISRAKKQQNSTGNINSAANIAGDDVTEQDVACSTPSEYIGTEVNQKKDGGCEGKNCKWRSRQFR
uniref:palmitoyltransferase ZDHHC11-like n=1 Tax=Styela clava TaxID=7725 RepID=UPI00193ADF06|nr:palmitoyltransferase ZDHHC11-like [Styela clava]XP_039264687.1 palmitoyltransferase ZDHHC11-like [Styela clava]